MTDKRIRLLREMYTTDDGRTLVDTVWTEPIPATLQGKIIGTVDQIRREGEGWVTGVVHTDRDVVGLASEVSVDKAQMEEDGDQVLVVGARLREVALGLKPVWEGMVITDDLDQVIEASLMDWYHPTAREHRKRLAQELTRIRDLPHDEIAAIIKNAYYHARDHGGTMHTAADVAADGVLALIRGEASA
jgi:hypothetical protein